VERADIRGLWSIQPIVNLASIAEHGILCHNAASRLPHGDISLASVQDIRRTKRVPDSRLDQAEWRLLHDYANLYVCPRNPMLYRRLDKQNELVVLRVTTNVLDIPGVVVTDGNAATRTTRFSEPAVGIALLDREVNFARDWNHSDPLVKAEHGRRMCAEVLVPERVPPDFIDLALVTSDEVAAACIGLPWPARVNDHMYFR
jgi:hypothetical protein